MYNDQFNSNFSYAEVRIYDMKPEFSQAILFSWTYQLAKYQFRINSSYPLPFQSYNREMKETTGKLELLFSLCCSKSL